VRIQNLSFVSYVYIISSLLLIHLNSSAFAFQAPTVESNSPSNPALASNDLLKSPQKNNVSAPANLTQTNWSQLSPEQKTALAPLANEWNKMDAVRQKKWLGVANKYASMKPEEQQRVQERVQTWVKMTPEQRMAVRENFANTSKKTPEQKSAQWQQYQQLSEAEKIKLANEAKLKKTITTIQPESKRTTAPLAPLKKGPPPTNSVSSSASQTGIK
jgi:hypothetical protein